MPEDAPRQRPNNIQLPPPPFAQPTLPPSSTFVFTSRRSGRSANKSNPSSPSSEPALSSAASTPAGEPLQGTPPLGKRRASVVLSDDQLHRHRRGSLDVRTLLMQAKTPAGFIQLAANSPPTPDSAPTRPSGSDNPYFPSHTTLSIEDRLFLPPVAIVRLNSTGYAEATWPRSRSDSLLPSALKYREIAADPSSSSSAVTAPPPSSSPAVKHKSVTFAPSTDVCINTPGDSKPRRHSLSAPIPHELSLSELIVGTNTSRSPPPPVMSPTLSSFATREHEAELETQRLKRIRDGKRRSAMRVNGADVYDSSSESERSSRTLASVEELDESVGRSGSVGGRRMEEMQPKAVRKARTTVRAPSMQDPRQEVGSDQTQPG